MTSGVPEDFLLAPLLTSLRHGGQAAKRGEGNEKLLTLILQEFLSGDTTLSSRRFLLRAGELSIVSPEYKKSFLPRLRGRLGGGTSLALKIALLCLAKRGESPEEILSVIRLFERLETRFVPGVPETLDVCGTGGDGKNTFNISTIAALVIAGAGGPVAKHGNRAISSRCGSSDLMEALGVRLDAAPSRMLAALKQCGMAYFHAPLYHPLLAKVAPLRRELGVRTLFNFLGPFLNPVRVQAQMLGCARKDFIKIFARILKLRHITRAVVLHSHDGLDEISTAAPTDVVELRRGVFRSWRLHPGTLGFLKARTGDYRGGDKQTNKKIALGILCGKIRGPARDVVLLNAAMGLYTGGRARHVREGLQLAGASVDQRRAYRVLQNLIRISNT